MIGRLVTWALMGDRSIFNHAHHRSYLLDAARSVTSPQKGNCSFIHDFLRFKVG